MTHHWNDLVLWLLVMFPIQTNFQAVVVTDESISFALFIYDDGVQSFVGPHRMGFDAGDRRRSLELDSRLLFQELIFRIDG